MATDLFIGINPAGLLKDFPCSYLVINPKLLRTEELEKYWKPSSSEGFVVGLISCHLSQKASNPVVSAWSGEENKLFHDTICLILRLVAFGLMSNAWRHGGQGAGAMKASSMETETNDPI
ncbi:hypothetical protein DUI87_10068 [Hirundo rustica rustica]|uniref:Uncharacterized protein n=1 Tax=Hirundo rustica rustica TaxID=333673 RepID=A0A3M0KH19_HIRRU|nr:hypothetical protein DUI87_10068 [Hirundo rustica rustica]